MTLTAETVREWGADLSNWGRWGDDDEIGTLNLITPDRVAAAAIERGLPDRQSALAEVQREVYALGAFSSV